MIFHELSNSQQIPAIDLLHQIAGVKCLYVGRSLVMVEF